MSRLEFVSIQKGQISRNGHAQFTDTGADFLKHAYRSLDIDYPKFHKMDVLSQIAFLGVEWLSDLLQDYSDDAVAQLFCNSSSSLSTDIKFRDSYHNSSNASPSLFVYTLPNIANGEIAIRHKLYGESQFFILMDFDPDFYAKRCEGLFSAGYEAVLCVWLEPVVNSENAAGLLFFVTPKNIDRIFELKNYL